MQVACQSCGAKYRVPDEKAGVKFRCPHCKGVVTTAKTPSTDRSAEAEHYIFWSKGHVRLDKGRVSVFGRSLGCDGMLDDSCCSRRHARVKWRDGAYHLADLGSRNGTFVDGKALTEELQLSHKDAFQIGADTFTYVVVENEEVLQLVVRQSRKDSQMRATKEMVAPEQMLGNNVFNGSLETMSPAEICQILKLGSRTGRLTITDRKGERGLLYFNGGDIVYAAYGAKMGEEAALLALHVLIGDFVYHPDVAAPGKNVTRKTEFLLLEAVRRDDETGHHAAIG